LSVTSNVQLLKPGTLIFIFALKEQFIPKINSVSFTRSTQQHALASLINLSSHNHCDQIIESAS